MEHKYNIKIRPHKAIIPIPTACKQYGQPFISKHVSEMIYRLQRHNFKFEDKSFDELYIEYPKCKSALEWWCNTKASQSHNIGQNKYLKEFLIENPPTFKISSKCCQYAKKDVMYRLLKDGDYDLSIVGVRRAEGGVRATAYKTCFDDNNDNGCDNYRPLFWYKNDDRDKYIEAYAIEPSKCYTEYGLKRTGCAGCPFGRNFEFELQVIWQYEPQLFKAVNNIFRESYEYTRCYREFCKQTEKDNKT